jgi:Na+/melibiose symporter-like transporter
MKIVYCVVPALAALAALWAMKNYSLNRARAEAVRAELSQRHAAAAV